MDGSGTADRRALLIRWRAERQASLDKVMKKLEPLEQQRDQIQAQVDAFDVLIRLEESSGQGVQMERRGQSLTDAAWSALSDAGHPMHYTILHTELANRGTTVGGQEPAKNLVAHLTRDPRFYRTERGVYGLAEWYDGVRQPVPEPVPDTTLNKEEADYDPFADE